MRWKQQSYLKSEIFGIFLMLVAVPMSGTAQTLPTRDEIAIQNQIQELHQRLANLRQRSALSAPKPIGNKTVVTSNSSDGGLVTQLLERVNVLEDKTRNLQGQLEEISKKWDMNAAAMKKQLEDMAFSSRQAGASKNESAAHQSEKAKMLTSENTRDIAVLLSRGQNQLKSQDYVSAYNTANTALDAAKNVSDKFFAQFLMAQALAGQKNYAQSAQAYFSAYTISPKDNNAPVALLGVSANMIQLKKNQAACEAISKMQSEFPRAAGRVKQAALDLKKQAGCK